MAKLVDPQGARTIGVITKADRLEAGTHAPWFKIIHGERAGCKLDLGYFVVRNPTPEELAAGISLEDAAVREASFFAGTAPWNGRAMDGWRGQLGVKNLRDALSEQLVRLTEKELPIIRAQVSRQT